MLSPPYITQTQPKTDLEYIRSEVYQLKKSNDNYTLRIKATQNKISELLGELNSLQPKKQNTSNIFAKYRMESIRKNHQKLTQHNQASQYIIEAYEALLKEYGVEAINKEDLEPVIIIPEDEQIITLNHIAKAEVTQYENFEYDDLDYSPQPIKPQTSPANNLPSLVSPKTRSIEKPTQNTINSKMRTLTAKPRMKYVKNPIAKINNTILRAKSISRPITQNRTKMAHNSYNPYNSIIPKIKIDHLNTERETAMLTCSLKINQCTERVNEIIHRFFNTFDAQVIKDRIAHLTRQNKLMKEVDQLMHDDIDQLKLKYDTIQCRAEEVNLDLRGIQRILFEGNYRIESTKYQIQNEKRSFKEFQIQNKILMKGVNKIATLFEIDTQQVEDDAITAGLSEDVGIGTHVLKTVADLFESDRTLLYLAKGTSYNRIHHKSNFSVVDSTSSSSKRLLSINELANPTQPQPFNSPPKPYQNDASMNRSSGLLNININVPIPGLTNLNLSSISSAGISISLGNALGTLSNMTGSFGNMSTALNSLGNMNQFSNAGPPNLLIPTIPLEKHGLGSSSSLINPQNRISRRVLTAKYSLRDSDPINDIEQELNFFGNSLGHVYVERFASQFMEYKDTCVPLEREEPHIKFNARLEVMLDSYSPKKILNGLFELYQQYKAYLYLLVFDNIEIYQIDSSFLDFLSQRDQFIDAFDRKYDADILQKEISEMLLNDEIITIWLIRDLVIKTESKQCIMWFFKKISPIFQRIQNQIPINTDISIIDPLTDLIAVTYEEVTTLVPFAALFATFMDLNTSTALHSKVTNVVTEKVSRCLPKLIEGKNSSENRSGMVSIFELGCHLPNLFHSHISFQNKATSFLHNFLRTSLNLPTCVKTATDFFIACHRYLDESVLMWHTFVFFDLMIREMGRLPLREINLNCYLSVMTVIVANRQKFTMEQLGRFFFLHFMINTIHLEELIGKNEDESQNSLSINSGDKNYTSYIPEPPKLFLFNQNKVEEEEDSNNYENEYDDFDYDDIDTDSDDYLFENTDKPVVDVAKPTPKIALPTLQIADPRADLRANQEDDFKLKEIPKKNKSYFELPKQNVSYLDLPKFPQLNDGLPSLNLENPKLQLHFQPIAEVAAIKPKVIKLTVTDYMKMRRKSPLYLSTEIHVHFIQLMFATLIDHSLHRLDVYFCDPFPQVNRKPNVLYTLMKHMESQYNEDICPMLKDMFTPPEDNFTNEEDFDDEDFDNPEDLEYADYNSGDVHITRKLGYIPSQPFPPPNMTLESVAEETDETPAASTNTSTSNISHTEHSNQSSLKSHHKNNADVKRSSVNNKITSVDSSASFQVKLFQPFKSVPNFIASNEDYLENSIQQTSRNQDDDLKMFKEEQRAQFQDYQRLLKMLVPALFHPEGYSNGTHIASGAFGAVMAVTYEGTLYAVKVLEKSRNEFDNPHLVEVFTEVSILEVCKGDRRVTQLFDYGCTADSYYIVMEFYPSTMKGWRKKYIKMNEKPPEAMLLRLYREFLKNCTVLTTHRINHFDIKCDNVMLDKDGYPALADFGESMSYKNELNNITLLNKGTEWIKSPEMLSIALNSYATNPNYDRRKRVGAGPASDIWSIGCLFFELMTGEFLFLDSDWSRFFLRITNPTKDLLTEENLALLNHNKKYSTFLEFVLQRSVLHRPDLQQVIVKFDEMFPDALNGPLPQLEIPKFNTNT